MRRIFLPGEPFANIFATMWEQSSAGGEWKFAQHYRHLAFNILVDIYSIFCRMSTFLTDVLAKAERGKCSNG
jgi:hypothetical protein